MPSTLTTFDPFLKENYDDAKINYLTCKDRPFLAKCKKTTGSGDIWITPVVFSNPQGLGATLVGAQTGSESGTTGGGNIQGKKWQIPWGDYSGSVSIGDKVIKASRDNVGAFFQDKTAEIDRLYEAFADTMSSYLLGDAGHSITPGTFTISTGVCTLVNADDIVNIEVGQLLQASANDGTSTGHALLGSGSIGYVFAVNSNAGTFTVAAAAASTTAATPTGWTGTMYGFRNTDFGGGATPNVILSGLSAWIPAADPGATTFYSVDRTTSMQRLSGTRLTTAEVAGLGIEQRIKKLVTRMVGRGMGPGPTDIFLNPEKWQGLADSVESRGTRPLDGKIGTLNFQKLQIAMGGKMLDIWADRFVSPNVCWAVNMDVVELKTLDGFPGVINGDGMQMLRKTTSNDYEYRIQSYPAFAVKAPGWCGRVPLV